MTEPTWKDELLQRMTWGENVRVAIETWPYAPKPGWSALGVYNWLALYFPQAPDLWNLRVLIDAELARGREAVDLLTSMQWHSMTDCGVCEECDGTPSDGHADDCQLGKIIGDKP